MSTAVICLDDAYSITFGLCSWTRPATVPVLDNSLAETLQLILHRYLFKVDAFILVQPVWFSKAAVAQIYSHLSRLSNAAVPTLQVISLDACLAASLVSPQLPHQLCIEFGHDCTQVLAVCDSLVLYPRSLDSCCLTGGQLMLEALRLRLSEVLPDVDVDASVVDWLFHNYCHVQQLQAASTDVIITLSLPVHPFSLQISFASLAIPAQFLFAPDALVGSSTEFLSKAMERTLPECIINALLSAPRSLLKSLVSNITLFGPFSTIPGLRARIKSELSLALSHANMEHLVPFIAFTASPALMLGKYRSDLCAWYGASLLGSITTSLPSGVLSTLHHQQQQPHVHPCHVSTLEKLVKAPLLTDWISFHGSAQEKPVLKNSLRRRGWRFDKEEHKWKPVLLINS